MADQQSQFGDLSSLLPILQGGGWKAHIRETIENLLALPQVRLTLAEACASRRENETIFSATLRLLQITLSGNRFQLPESGPCLVIANHPYGGVDALALASLCSERRADTLILANAELAKLPGISEWILPLDILSGKEAARRNIASLKKAHQHLAEGGVLGVFPAGAVSRWDWEKGEIRDPEWSTHIGSFITKTKVPVLPLAFLGGNSPWFHFFGELSPLLRTILIPRAFLGARKQTLRFLAGPLTHFEHLDRSQVILEARELVEKLRKRS